MAIAPNQPAATLPTADDVADHNASVIAKVASQDAAGNPTPDLAGQKDTNDVLDKLAKEAEEKAAGKGQPPVAPKPGVDDEAAKKAAAEAAQKAEADKKAAEEREALAKKADEGIFKGEPGLPPNASPKSHEAFSAIKVKAAQEISKLTSEIEAMKKELAEHKEKSSKPSVEQEAIRKENQELKEWRAKLDVDFDPRFKQFDTDMATAREFIQEKLRSTGAFTEETLQSIQKLGGLDKVKSKPVLDLIKDEYTRRLVEGELGNIEKIKYNRAQAVTKAKENIQQWVAGRQEELGKADEVRTAEVKKELNEALGQLEWTKPLTHKQGATAEELAAVDTHNKFLTELRKELETAAADNSPKMKATLLTATAQLLNLKQVYFTLKDAHDALEKEAVELRAFKEKYKQGTRSRLPESQAPAAGTIVQKPKDIFNTSAADGIDAAAKQVMAERAARAQS